MKSGILAFKIDILYVQNKIYAPTSFGVTNTESVVVRTSDNEKKDICHWKASVLTRLSWQVKTTFIKCINVLGQQNP